MFFFNMESFLKTARRCWYGLFGLCQHLAPIFLWVCIIDEITRTSCTFVTLYTAHQKTNSISSGNFIILTDYKNF
jgi:hypothetical protein